MFLKSTNPLEQCQLKFASEEEGVFEGYASVFNSVDQVGDTIAPGAFTKSLSSGRTVKMFVNHIQNKVPVGDWVKMFEDDRGLRAVGKIDMNHRDGMTVYSALKRGAMDGLSIGFTMKDGDWEQKDQGRVIKNMSLMETSIVNFPCEGRATISAVKADLSGLMTLKDFEDYLRDAGGFSRSMATALISQLVKCVHREDDDAKRELAKQAGVEALAIFQQLKAKL